MQSRMRLFLLIGSLLFCLTGCRHITTTDVVCTTEQEEPEYTVIAMLSDSIVQTQHTVKQAQLLFLFWGGFLLGPNGILCG